MKQAKAVPVRPRHIDQYVHLLPKATQEKAASVKDMLRDLDTARENARRLMESGEHPDKVAMWAKTATKLDDRVKSVYRELDAGWDRLVKEGRVTVDDFGNAHVAETAEKTADTEAADGKAEKDEAPKKRGRKPMTEEEKADARAARDEKKAEEVRRKVAQLRKWLVDKRNAKTPEQAAKWRERYGEMVRIGGKESVTAKVTEAAEYYGIDI